MIEQDTKMICSDCIDGFKEYLDEARIKQIVGEIITENITARTRCNFSMGEK